MKIISSSVLAFLACASTLNAQNLDQWSGPYVGVALSYSSADTSIFGSPFTYNQAGTKTVTHDYHGAGIDVFVGINHRNGNIIHGGEFELSVGDLESNLVFNNDNDIDQVAVNWSAAVVGRIGIVHQDTLFYAKGGLAFTDIENVGGDVNSGNLTVSDAHMRDEIRVGPTVGVGLERYLAENWVGRIDYSYTEFYSYRQNNSDQVQVQQFYIVDNGPIQKLSVGIAFQF